MLMAMRHKAAVLLIAVVTIVSASFELQKGSDADLTRFVTRPEIRAPLFDIQFRADAGVTPGFWFIAPYANIRQEPQPARYYQPCSTGPHIYDGNGELVWSGACQFRNQNACDFRVFTAENGERYLSSIFTGYEDDLSSLAVTMDNSYQLLRNITPPAVEPKLNMHEWNVIEDGRTGLYLTNRAIRVDVSELELANRTTGSVSEIGFREVDIASGDTTFEWWSGGKISPSEAVIPVNHNEIAGPPPQGWNWFHPNSVDKDQRGDYMISGRFTDSIFKIGSNGDILWRLGGKKSSFRLTNFNFSKQHDARFISRNGNTETISLFDNAAALHPGLDVPTTSNRSSVMIIVLDLDSMTATKIRQHYQPDGQLTPLRGNFQLLPNGNAFVCWANDSYISEHDPDDNLLLSARFRAPRFVTYRGYKFNFTGRPIEDPVLKVQVIGESWSSSTTLWHVSWNGATEVAEWQFYAVDDCDSSAKPQLKGSTAKVGFETAFYSVGHLQHAYAVAVSRNGSVLGQTAVQTADVPHHLRSVTPGVEGVLHAEDSLLTSSEAWHAKDEL